MKRFGVYIKLSTILFLIGLIILLYGVYDVGNRIERHLYGVKLGVTLEHKEIEGFLPGEVEKLVQEMARDKIITPKNAYIDRETGEIFPEVIGQEVDVAKTVNKVMKARENYNINLITVELYPEVTEELLSSIHDIIGSYFTWHGSGSSRVTNIRMGTYYINNTLLHPGEIFSFNKTVGPVTVERGFKFAPVISSGSIILGLGGGLCQVSSTLYNAVLEAELQVVERYPHSKPVGYVPPGRDATVSYHLDFKFLNSTDSFILIKGSIWGGRVQIDLLSNQVKDEETF
ncbi:MAG: hypothetical protein D5R97_05950 [Candidatus Syntrophonatronum acetioxidans]|uniref:Peptidoglycan binding domain-containing protein n=1 Tax=Candidatus Syntrophonatronum acetioxidans TaxID=1795816 RepID=A0A424YDD0_9FIRM|nr:MAG: hypothetical protein D5R97_05950 [Candidatus Syntrophonatronum acetioxidans]